MEQRIRKIKPRKKPDDMEEDIFSNLIITVVRDEASEKSRSTYSFHQGVEFDFSKEYLLDYSENVDFPYLSSEWKKDTPLVFYSSIIPLSEKDVDEYVETGSFTSKRIRDRIEELRKQDASGHLDSLLEVFDSHGDLHSPSNLILN